MAAGLGFKTFNTGDVLSAADVNGYLMQGVLVFTDATARDAAITSPQEGQFAYTKNNDSLWYYSGSAWVASGATGDIEGVTAGTGISGGGTSGTVTITNSMATAIDAKGDLVVGTGADTFSRLAVGTNNYVLTADSSTSTGLAWSAPASGGGMTLLSTTTLSGSTTTISSINTTYKHLYIVGKGIEANAANVQVFGRINGITSSSYTYAGVGDRLTSGVISNEGIDQTSFFVGQSNGVAVGYKDLCHFRLDFPRYSETEYKYYQLQSYGTNDTLNSNRIMWWVNGIWNDTAAITSLTFFTSTSTFSAGTIYIYGVN